MTYRLPGGRVTLTIEDGPYAGVWVEVERVGLWLVYASAVSLAAKALAASAADRVGAFQKAYETFVIEAQPAWDIEDHKGRVPATAAGMWRLPEVLALTFLQVWAETYGTEEAAEPVAEPVATAVDKLMPPGPLRDVLNERLRAVA